MSASALDRDVILAHAVERHGAGLREPFDVEVAELNPTCGDQVVLRLLLDGDLVRDLSYRALGCTVSQAAVSAMADLVVGGTSGGARSARERFGRLVRGEEVDGDAELLGDAAAFRAVARNPVRMRCALLGWRALDAALDRALPGHAVPAPSGRPGD